MFSQTTIMARPDDPAKERSGEYPDGDELSDGCKQSCNNGCANQATELKELLLPAAIGDILSSLTEIDKQLSSPISLDGVCEI